MRRAVLLAGWVALSVLSGSRVALSAEIGTATGNGLAELERLVGAEPGAVTARDAAGSTLLHYAAQGGNREAVEFLLAHGADANARGALDATPLHSAATTFDVTAMSNALAQEGGSLPAIVDALSRSDCRSAAGGGAAFRPHAPRLLREQLAAAALPAAVLAAKAQIVRILVAHGADADARAACDQTPLHLAVMSRIPDVASALLSAGARVDLRNAFGDTPLNTAAGFASARVVELLLGRGADVDAAGDGDQTPLFMAVRADALPNVEVLLAHRAAVAARDREGFTALNTAAELGYADVAAALLAAGADANAPSGDGRTPLHSAAQAGREEVLRLLLASKANVGAREHNGATPLHSAAFGGQPKIAALLLDAGAEIEAKTKTGMTPLQAAVHGHSAEVVRLLVGRHADVAAIEQTATVVTDRDPAIRALDIRGASYSSYGVKVVYQYRTPGRHSLVLSRSADQGAIFAAADGRAVLYDLASGSIEVLSGVRPRIGVEFGEEGARLIWRVEALAPAGGEATAYVDFPSMVRHQPKVVSRRLADLGGGLYKLIDTFESGGCVAYELDLSSAVPFRGVELQDGAGRRELLVEIRLNEQATTPFYRLPATERLQGAFSVAERGFPDDLPGAMREVLRMFLPLVMDDTDDSRDGLDRAMGEGHDWTALRERYVRDMPKLRELLPMP